MTEGAPWSAETKADPLGNALAHEGSMADAALTPRQQREIDYHRAYAEKMAAERMGPVAFDVTDERRKRRWWNAYWSVYDLLLRHDLKGKRVLAPGCGFGEDAVRLARLGAMVEAFDISPDIIKVAEARAARNGYDNIRFTVSACEALDFPAAHFDVVFFLDILHHVDIPASVAEARRVLKPGGRIIGDELYTHSALQKNIREHPIVRGALYPAMKRFIYGKNDPYITQDEHKIDETEFRHVVDACATIDIQYFNGAAGRLFPDRLPVLPQLDRLAMKAAGGAGKFLAGRVVFDGVVRK